jgi:hypothetical protein
MTAYVCAIVLLIGIWSVWQFPRLSSSAVYFTQGFDLLLPGKDPSEWPYFGERFGMPIMYVTHAIGATFGLLSIGDPADFYLNGQYLLNILLAPLLPLGAYFWFSRRLPWWFAALAALVFCAFIFDFKITSMRGETLGWISGFAFLLVLDDFFRAADRAQSAGTPIRLAIVLAFLYFALSLTHGVSAAVASFFGLGIIAHWAITHRGLRHYILLCKAGAISFGLLALLAIVYVYSFSPGHNFSKVMYHYDRPPVAGEEDPALLFENAISRPYSWPVRKVRAAPPYTSRLLTAETAAFLPPAALPRFFITGYRLTNVTLAAFPTEAFDRLAGISAAERLAYVAIFLFCCGIYAYPFRKFDKRYTAVFCGSVGVYLLLIAFSIFLDMRSVSLFPLAAIRRTYAYVGFFYWLAVCTTVLEFIVRPAASFLRTALRAAVRTALKTAVWPVVFPRYAAYAWGLFSVYILLLWLSGHNQIRYMLVAFIAWAVTSVLLIEISAGFSHSALLTKFRRDYPILFAYLDSCAESIRNKIGTYSILVFS